MTAFIIVLLIAGIVLFAQKAERLNMNVFSLLTLCLVVGFCVLAATGSMP